MGKRSTKSQKNIYQQSREAAGLTRESASEALQFVSADRIERIESEKTEPHPEEVLAMSNCYKNYSLCNYYCSNECPIGREYVPEVELKELSQITLEMLHSLNIMEREKNRLIDITVDGVISKDEQEDFRRIQQRLEEISIAVEALQLWMQQAEAEGKIEQA